MAMSHPSPTPLPDIQDVTIDADRCIRVNGEPFVPIFAWWVDGKHFDALAGTGVNVALSPRADLDYARAAADRGMYIGANPRKDMAGHPRLLFWMHEDEPDCRIPDGPRLLMGEDHVPAQATGEVPAEALIQQVMPALKQRRDHCRSLGDGRPVFLNFSYLFLERFWGPDAISRPLYAAMAAAGDVLSWDIYPIAVSGRTDWLPLIYDGTDRLGSFAPDKPTCMFIECVRIREGYGARDPSEQEMRNEVWQAIAAGARGIGYFTFGSKQSDSFADRSFAVSPQNQAAMARINAEVTANTALVCAEQLACGVRRDAAGMPEVAVSLRRDAKHLYFLAVNMRYERHSIDLGKTLSLSLSTSPEAAQKAIERVPADVLADMAPLEVRITSVAAR